ncbi:hypothetical protein SprV_0301056400 [Sparganum proliferum]
MPELVGASYSRDGGYTASESSDAIYDVKEEEEEKKNEEVVLPSLSLPSRLPQPCLLARTTSIVKLTTTTAATADGCLLLRRSPFCTHERARARETREEARGASFDLCRWRRRRRRQQGGRFLASKIKNRSVSTGGWSGRFE